MTRDEIAERIRKELREAWKTMGQARLYSGELAKELDVPLDDVLRAGDYLRQNAEVRVDPGPFGGTSFVPTKWFLKQNGLDD